MSSVAQILEAYGRTQAELASERGRIWGGAVQQIGQLPLQIQQQALLKAREQRLNQQAASEQELTRLKVQEAQRQAQERAGQDFVFGQDIYDENGDVDPAKASQVAIDNKMGHLVPGLRKQVAEWREQSERTREAKAKADEANAALTDRRRDALGVAAIGVDPTDDGTFRSLIGHAVNNQWLSADEGQRFVSMPPEARKSILNNFIRQSKDATERLKPREVPPGGTLIDPMTNQPVFTAPEKPSPSQTHTMRLPGVGDVPVDYVPNKDGTGGKWMYQGKDVTGQLRAIPPTVSPMGALYADVDPKAVAAAIRGGTHPPDISQYGRPASAAIASELAKPGPNGEPAFNLASAQREWKAQLNLNRTMNGAQQVRLDESIRSGLAMYDRIDALADEWDGKGWGPLSRANLEAARQGVKGAAAQKLAVQLTGQIGQLTSDVATIEQGGLTPTADARHVAELSLQDWWGKGTIEAMTAQGRANMQIRHMARQTQEPMAPGNAPSTAPAQPATPAPVNAAPKLGEVVTVKGIRLRVTKVNPDGSYEGVGVK